MLSTLVPTPARATGALLGLAIGDAFGLQLAGAADPLSAPIVSEGPLLWSGRTEQAVLAGLALARVGPAASPSEVAEAFGSELVHWWHLPAEVARSLSPATRRAAARLVAGERWDAVGDSTPGGADAAFRAVAVGIARPADEAPAVARALASVTHRHPTALEGAVATAWLVSSLTRGRPLDAALVAEAGAVVSAQGLGGNLTGLLVGVDAPHARGEADDPFVPLAIWTALAAGAPGPLACEHALGAAARLPHGEAVAGLTGALLGSAWGAEAIPAHLAARLQSHRPLARLAAALGEQP